MIEYKLQKKEEQPSTFSLANTALRIVFMGTPEFAVDSLDALVRAGFQIVGVVTAPDKPAGRGLSMQESAVKKYAKEHGLKILQPLKLKDPAFIDELRSLNPDLQVVVAFRMLPESVWSLPRMGTINLHASLLPQYRGAAPINWAIIKGEKITGVTTFRLKHEIDTGDILLQESFPIGTHENAGQLHDRMKEIGAHLLVTTVRGLADGSLEPKPQAAVAAEEHIQINHAPKIHTETCRIDWSQPVENVFNLVRGLSPYPGAFTVINEKMLKIFEAERDLENPKETPGDYETDGKTFLKFACTNGYLDLREVQMEGKKRMKIEDFLRGHRFE
jgi:methionyl-tRNA formyltransferase